MSKMNNDYEDIWYSLKEMLIRANVISSEANIKKIIEEMGRLELDISSF